MLAGAPAARAQDTVAIVGASVIPMDRETVLADQTVLVAGSRIVALGDRRATPVPAGARSLDARGRYLLPGLADMHVHLLGDSTELLLYLANGVTTIRDLAGQPLTRRWRDEIAAGTRLGPRMYVASPIVNAPAGRRVTAFRWGSGVAIAAALYLLAWLLLRRLAAPARLAARLLAVPAALAAGFVVVRAVVSFPDGLLPRTEVPRWWVWSPAEASRAARAAGREYDLLKLYDGLAPEQFRAATRAARAAGVHSVAHVPAGMSLGDVLGSGLDELAHIYFIVLDLQPGDSAQRLAGDVRDIRAARVAVTSTLMPIPEIVQRQRDSAAFFARADFQYRTPNTREYLRQEARKPMPAQLLAILEMHTRWGTAAAAALVRGGALLVLGTDTSPHDAVAGFSAHQELALFTGAGMTPYAALRTATVNASIVAGREREWGVVAPGGRADLLLVSGNPLADLTVLRRPEGVMAGGRWHDRAALDSMLATVAARRAANPSS